MKAEIFCLIFTRAVLCICWWLIAPSCKVSIQFVSQNFILKKEEAWVLYFLKSWFNNFLGRMNTKSDRSLSIEHSAIYFEAGDNHCQVVINNARTSFYIRSNLSWVQSELSNIFINILKMIKFTCLFSLLVTTATMISDTSPCSPPQHCPGEEEMFMLIRTSSGCWERAHPRRILRKLKK